MKPGSKKEGHMEGYLKTYSKIGDESRVPFEMWDKREWAYEGEREIKAHNILWEDYIKMVEEEVDDRICASTQTEFVLV